MPQCGGRGRSGAQAVLLIGFPSPGEVEAFRSMMLEMEADMFKVRCSLIMEERRG